VTFEQLLSAGLSPAGIQRRVVAGRLHRIHRGVYAVGHPGLSTEGRWKAATLAYGATALLSHRSAAELWGMLPPSMGVIHVSVPGRAGRNSRGGIRVHRPCSLAVAVRRSRGGIPVTSPARTIADLRSTCSPATVRRAIREAEIARYPLGATDPDRTRSALEGKLLRLCRRHRLPEPEVNARVGPFTVDFLWRPQRLIVEVDGYAYHRGRQAFRDDRDRDLELALRGFSVHRLADTRIAEDPAGVAAALRGLLRQAGTS
jgi:very-short-patch-repair endonuclease